jgi:hydroxyacylglutathione hydrolase
MALIIEQFLCRTDNFGVVIHDSDSGQTASIVAPEEGPIRETLSAKGARLDRIFVTHHHADHVAANLALKAAYGCTIVGPEAEADKIPGIDEPVRGDDRFMFGTFEVRIIPTPGHTIGHVCYWLPGAEVAFVGDTMFSMGCGRLFEGTAQDMWASLTKLRALPDETAIFCGHEYTATNARFALTIEPDNADLVARDEEVRNLTASGEPTLPTTVRMEKATNPFLRADMLGMSGRLGMGQATPDAVFAEIRKRRDTFK